MRRLVPAALVVAMVGVWQIATGTDALADALGLQPTLVASPSQIASALWSNRSLLADNAWVTLREVVPGFLVAVAIGFTLAVALHLFESLRSAVQPLLIASQTIPVIVIAPILVAWFGYGIGPKVGIIALICFFPIAVNTLDGLRSVDPDAVAMMRTLDAGPTQILRRVELPTSLPHLFTGARIAVAIAVIGAVFGEWSGSDSGLGHMILQDNAQLATARMFAAVVVLSAMAIVLYAAVAAAERVVVRW